MMMIGWSVLALQGGEEGNVDVLADVGEGEGDEDEEKDRQRVEKWLHREAVRSSNDTATTNGEAAKRPLRYVLREGLDAVYSQSWREMMARAAANGEEAAEGVVATSTPAADPSSASPFDLAQRDKEAGWAPARYGAAARAASLVGGWTAGEDLTDEQKERLRRREGGNIVQ